MTAEKRLYDYLQSFPQGINSSIDPLLLPKGQLAFMSNGTNRGDMARQRPAYNKQTLSGQFGMVQFQRGKFQAWCYYSPSPGIEYLMVVVDGFLFKISMSGSVATVTFAVPGQSTRDMSPDVNVHWLWQSERWLIWNDGINLPMFFDGVTKFRSVGDSGGAFGVTAAAFTAPNSNQPVSGDVQLTGPYQGPIGSAVLINSATYYVKSAYSQVSQGSTSPTGYYSAVMSGIAGSYTAGDILYPAAQLSLNNQIQGCILSAYLSDAAGNNTGGAINTWPAPVGAITPAIQFEVDFIAQNPVLNIYGSSFWTSVVGYTNALVVDVGDTILIGTHPVVVDSVHYNSSSSLGYSSMICHPADASGSGELIAGTITVNAIHTVIATGGGLVPTIPGTFPAAKWLTNPQPKNYPPVPANYFTMTLTQNFTGNVGDTLNVAGTLLTVVAKNGNQVTCTNNSASQTGNIPFIASTATAPTSSQIVLDTTLAQSLTLVGTYPPTDGVIPNPTPNGNVAVGSSMVFPQQGTDISGILSNGLQPHQIVQVTNPVGSGGTASMLLFVGSTGIINPSGQAYGQTTYWVSLVNQTDTPGNVEPAGSPLYAIPQLPVGKMGVYAQGRNWMCLADGQSFIASDIVGSSSGTAANNYLDAVLNVSQNQSLAGGGTFRLPSAGTLIQAMAFIPTLDVSLGQGPVQILTKNTVFSCSAPADMTTWATLTTPIVTVSLSGSGAVSQDCVVTENLDLFWRTPEGYIRSLMLARLDFNQWGNTPISREMARSLDGDDPTLLYSNSAAVFKNRLLVACQPSLNSRCVAHSAIAVLNFDALSTIQNKQPSCWEGEWAAPVGAPIAGIKTGSFSGIERCFMLCVNTTTTTPNFPQIELHELLPDDAAFSDDVSTPVSWFIESPMLFIDDLRKGRQYKRLINGDFSVNGIKSDVAYQVLYRSDQFSSWVPWYASIIKHQPSDPGFRSRIGLGMPDPKLFDSINNRPLREGYNFQVKFVFSGYCILMGARFMADAIDEPEFAQPK